MSSKAGRIFDPKSCFLCQKEGVICDLGRPCGNCKTKGVSHMCLGTELHSRSNTTTNNNNKTLSLASSVQQYSSSMPSGASNIGSRASNIATTRASNTTSNTAPTRASNITSTTSSVKQSNAHGFNNTTKQSKVVVPQIESPPNYNYSYDDADQRQQQEQEHQRQHQQQHQQEHRHPQQQQQQQQQQQPTDDGSTAGTYRGAPTTTITSRISTSTITDPSSDYTSTSSRYQPYGNQGEMFNDEMEMMGGVSPTTHATTSYMMSTSPPSSTYMMSTSPPPSTYMMSPSPPPSTYMTIEPKRVKRPKRSRTNTDTLSYESSAQHQHHQQQQHQHHQHHQQQEEEQSSWVSGPVRDSHYHWSNPSSHPHHLHHYNNNNNNNSALMSTIKGPGELSLYDDGQQRMNVELANEVNRLQKEVSRVNQEMSVLQLQNEKLNTQVLKLMEGYSAVNQIQQYISQLNLLPPHTTSNTSNTTANTTASSSSSNVPLITNTSSGGGAAGTMNNPEKMAQLLPLSQFYQASSRHQNIPIALFDISHNPPLVVMANHAFGKMFGYDDVRGYPWITFIDPKYLDRTANLLRATSQNHKAIKFIQVYKSRESHTPVLAVDVHKFYWLGPRKQMDLVEIHRVDGLTLPLPDSKTFWPVHVNEATMNEAGTLEMPSSETSHRTETNSLPSNPSSSNPFNNDDNHNTHHLAASLTHSTGITLGEDQENPINLSVGDFRMHHDKSSSNNADRMFDKTTDRNNTMDRNTLQTGREQQQQQQQQQQQTPISGWKIQKVSSPGTDPSSSSTPPLQHNLWLNMSQDMDMGFAGSNQVEELSSAPNSAVQTPNSYNHPHSYSHPHPHHHPSSHFPSSPINPYEPQMVGTGYGSHMQLSGSGEGWQASWRDESNGDLPRGPGLDDLPPPIDFSPHSLESFDSTGSTVFDAPHTGFDDAMAMDTTNTVDTLVDPTTTTTITIPAIPTDMGMENPLGDNLDVPNFPYGFDSSSWTT